MIVEKIKEQLQKLESKFLDKKVSPLPQTTMENNKDIKEDQEIKNVPVIKEKKTYEYKLPSLSILKRKPREKETSDFQHENVSKIDDVFKGFNLNAQVLEVHNTPNTQIYEVQMRGTKISKIESIVPELEVALGNDNIRLIIPMPEKNTIGIEVPSKGNNLVSFKETFSSYKKEITNTNILVTLGKDCFGQNKRLNLEEITSLLICGYTGSGKTEFINTIICSILMGYSPFDVKLVVINTKKELDYYNGIPHLLCPIVSNPNKALVILQKIMREMEKRYDLFSEKKVKKISEYNEWVELENRNNSNINLNKMPYIVVIIDEIADLMLVAAKEIEYSIMQITQMARAVGIHLIVTTQRPTNHVLSTNLKINFSTRISFAVRTSEDSKRVLDTFGAEKLFGNGDMLYLSASNDVLERIQGCFITNEEIKSLIDYCVHQMPTKYDEEISFTKTSHKELFENDNIEGDYDEPMYDEIVKFAIETGKISASLIQRRFRFGFNRAARAIDLLESRGVIGPQNGSHPREVLIKNSDFNEK